MALQSGRFSITFQSALPGVAVAGVRKVKFNSTVSPVTINSVTSSGSTYAASWVRFRNQGKYKIESGSFWNGYIDVGAPDVESGSLTLSPISLLSTRNFQSGAITVTDGLSLSMSSSTGHVKIPCAWSLSDGVIIYIGEARLVSSSWFRSGARYFITRFLQKPNL
jgi:hypothetical protein